MLHSSLSRGTAIQLNPFFLHDVAVLRCAAAMLESPPVSYTCSEFPAVQMDAVMAAHTAIGHRIAHHRAQRRFDNGLRFLRFDHEGVPVGSAWIVNDGARYIDEFNWLLPIGPNELWVRDVFVAPHWRGRRAFAAFVGLMAQCSSKPCDTVWSDVDWINRPSMQAHLAAGFEVFSRSRALDFRGRVRLRSALPNWHLPVREILPHRRWIWLRGAERQRHEMLVA